MTDLQMPLARDFGWDLKPVTSSLFEIHQRDNGQFCVVLNHALLRGVRAEMIHWWFLNFPNLKVRLGDVAGYDNEQVPGYLLWHPVDHLSAALSGNLGPGGTAKSGCSIQIQEAMQYDVYGWKYPVDAKLRVLYVGGDGWAMGKVLPFVGPVMMLRIHFKDVFDGQRHLGVHYHYEVVIGASGNGLVSRQINRKITGHFGPEFFAAWQRHNVIEVGTFENFLPALYAQRQSLSSLDYAPDMNPIGKDAETQTAFSRDLFDKRLAGYRETNDPSRFQQYETASFL
ncbi:MAG: hypothetical protein AAGC96_06295 [Pseudomonadota bacterium]